MLLCPKVDITVVIEFFRVGDERMLLCLKVDTTGFSASIHEQLLLRKVWWQGNLLCFNQLLELVEQVNLS
jgi:hypothetical protein